MNYKQQLLKSQGSSTSTHVFNAIQRNYVTHINVSSIDSDYVGNFGK
jgi:hypothetical protein